MPDFEQTDSALNPVRLPTLRGKYILVDFWASWCVPCRKQNPFLVDTHQKFASKGVDILGVSLDTSRDTASISSYYWKSARGSLSYVYTTVCLTVKNDLWQSTLYLSSVCCKPLLLILPDIWPQEILYTAII